jgi:photosystem II stability/assembly factor-like uncharacterized protein
MEATSGRPQPSGTTKTLYGISFTDTNNGTICGFELGSTGIILRTTDGGSNWVEQTNYSLPQGANSFYAVSFTDANTGTIVGDAGIILQTTNGGEQWNSQPTVTFNYSYGVSFTDANTGTAVGYENPDGMILRTTDGSNTWVRQSSGIGDPFDGINFFGVHFVNSNIGTIVGDDGIILRTTDGGNNWDQQTATQLTCFMPCTSAMKITARPSASSMEQFTEQPMADKPGPRKQVRQQAFSEFILLMPIMALSLATTV